MTTKRLRVVEKAIRDAVARLHQLGEDGEVAAQLRFAHMLVTGELARRDAIAAGAK